MLQLSQAMSRLGTESAFEVLARAKALEAKGKSIINLGIGQPDFLTPPHIVEAAIKALRDGQHGYTPANGIPQLREAVVVSEAFRGKSRVQQHQLIYKALGERMREEIHALSMRTLTPEQWHG